MRIDSTYGNVRFSCQDAGGQAKPVTTHEEEEYPGYYHKAIAEGEDGEIIGSCATSWNFWRP